MCGRSLSDVSSQTIDEIEEERASEERRDEALETKTIRRAAERSFLKSLSIFAIACGLVAGGLWLMFNFTNQPLTLVLAVFLLIFGAILLQIALQLPIPITYPRGMGPARFTGITYGIIEQLVGRSSRGLRY